MQEHTDVSSGVQNEIAIAFEANAVAFYAQISGLAKDKIGYPIRELATNAWDASRGRFEIFLPTPLSPFYRVRDYGPGMSADTMRDVYARLYASTKRGSNDEVGGWGLGSKSPFAYLIGDGGAGSYTVISYNGGMARTYVLSLSQTGAPVMRMLAEIPSDEPSGMDVSFPVKREDIRTFHDRAKSILWSFQPRPTITPAIAWAEPIVLASGEGWAKYAFGKVPFYGPQVRMGCVMYPLDLSQLKTTGFLTEEDHIVFDAPIGSLKVTLSREELAYDDRTKATLSALVKAYEDNVVSQVSAKVNEATDYFKACQLFEEATNDLGIHRQGKLREIVRWNGREINIWICESKELFKTMFLRQGWLTFDKFDHHAVRTSICDEAKIVLEHNPLYSLARMQAAGMLGQKLLWVRCKRYNRDAVLTALGNPEVVDLDSFKVQVDRTARSKTTKRRKVLSLTPAGGVHRSVEDVDMSEGGYYAVQTGTGRRRRSETYYLSDTMYSINGDALDDALETAISLGALDPIDILLKKDTDVLGDNWLPIGPELVSALTSKLDVSEFTGLHKKNIHSLNSRVRVLAETMDLTGAPADLLEFRAEAKALAVALRAQGEGKVSNSDRAHSALQKLGQKVDLPSVSDPLAAIERRYETLAENTYPLLALIMTNAGNYYHRSSDVQRNLNEYFKLLARVPLVSEVPTPVAANDYEFEGDVEVDDDEFEGDIDVAA
jgi:hypothetical protein